MITTLSKIQNQLARQYSHIIVVAMHAKCIKCCDSIHTEDQESKLHVCVNTNRIEMSITPSNSSESANFQFLYRRERAGIEHQISQS